MVRLLASLTVSLLANAIGLFVASLILDGFNITGLSFVIAVAIFTVVAVIADPLITKLAIKNLPALRGGVALVTTFVGLFITNLVSSGISISGFQTWVLATLIVWLFGLLATLALPYIVFKKTLARSK